MEAQPKCNLIIDSCCDLPFEVVDRPGVQLLEFPYIDEKGEHSDDFYRSVTPHEFYEGMRAGSQPSTAQVPVTVQPYPEALHGFLEVNRPDYDPNDPRRTPEQESMCRHCEGVIIRWLRAECLR